MIIVSHPTGNTFVRAVLEGLESGESGPFEFHTTIGSAQTGPNPSKTTGLIERLSRRSYPIAPSHLHRHPFRETVRLVAGRLGWERLVRHEKGWASVDQVYRTLDAAVAARVRQRPKVTAVYAYEDGARDTFLAAREIGVRRVYNLPIAYWETCGRLLREEAERLPRWAHTLGATLDSAEKLQRKTEEIAAADVVVCPSTFVLQSLPDAIRSRKQCAVVPFGSPEPPSSTDPASRRTAKTLRVLFAGSMSQRKGLADVFAAMRLLGRADVELVVLGSLIGPMEFYRQEFPHFHYEAPRSHGKVLDLMKTCDLLVLPSIVEGRALVQQEAMSCGLPVVVTVNAGAEDLVEERVTGFVVPIRDPAAIAERIAWFADHRADLSAMACAAQRKAESLTWSAYWAAHRAIFDSIRLREA